MESGCWEEEEAQIEWESRFLKAAWCKQEARSMPIAKERFWGEKIEYQYLRKISHFVNF
jgi:hypothetical protein